MAAPSSARLAWAWIPICHARRRQGHRRHGQLRWPDQRARRAQRRRHRCDAHRLQPKALDLLPASRPLPAAQTAAALSSRPAPDSSARCSPSAAVADIVRMVEAAQSRTAPVQRFADVVAVRAAGARGPCQPTSQLILCCMGTDTSQRRGVACCSRVWRLSRRAGTLWECVNGRPSPPCAVVASFAGQVHVRSYWHRGSGLCLLGGRRHSHLPSGKPG